MFLETLQLVGEFYQGIFLEVGSNMQDSNIFISAISIEIGYTLTIAINGDETWQMMG